tara:strand:+ start:314 stop:769 length:456 start_codon:yes stop_codon:yes gene_type:complete
MIQLIRTNSQNQDFIALVTKLDAGLAITDGDEHAFYDQFNKIDAIKYVIVAYQDKIAVGCGAIKEYEAQTMEVKRMYVDPNFRGNGIASTILNELEKWSREMSYNKCILETGKRQVEAIALYRKNDYLKIANYGQYTGVLNSLCFEKNLKL